MWMYGYILVYLLEVEVYCILRVIGMIVCY